MDVDDDTANWCTAPTTTRLENHNRDPARASTRPGDGSPLIGEQAVRLCRTKAARALTL
jgi:hypothetical protein